MLRVVLVEDNPILRIAQESLLRKAGYEVIHAVDGEEALRVIKSERPDVVLLDMMLPKLSGPEVLCRLKSDPATAHIPVVVVTGLSSKNEEKLERAGASGFVEKDGLMHAPERLIRAIERATGQDHQLSSSRLKTQAATNAITT